MRQAKRELPKYLRTVRPIDPRHLELLDLDDLLCSQGRGGGIGLGLEAVLDREMDRMRREIIQARLTRAHRCGVPLCRQGYL